MKHLFAQVREKINLLEKEADRVVREAHEPTVVFYEHGRNAACKFLKQWLNQYTTDPSSPFHETLRYQQIKREVDAMLKMIGDGDEVAGTSTCWYISGFHSVFFDLSILLKHYVAAREGEYEQD